jgi:Flp pilus assembly pilin Flp
LTRERLHLHVSIAQLRYGAKRAVGLGTPPLRRVTKEEDMVRFALMAFRSFVRKDEAQDLVEYALLVALIVLGAVAFLTQAGDSVQAIFQSIAGDLADAQAEGN